MVKPKEMTLDEVRNELGLASKNFYMDKLMNLEKLSPEKQEFMIKVTKIIANNSYLKEHMKGEMPEAMKKIFSRYGFEEPVASKEA